MEAGRIQGNKKVMAEAFDLGKKLFPGES